jgi:hypothetical protein
MSEQLGQPIVAVIPDLPVVATSGCTLGRIQDTRFMP